MAANKLTKIISLCKRRGFIFGGSQIYGGLSSIWDYGPLGVSLKKKIKDIWWKEYVEHRNDIVGLDSSIIMAEGVFLASGHLKGFSDLLVDCSSCGKRSRLDMIEKISENIYKCPECKKEIDIKKNPPRQFNLMFKTNMSAAENKPYYGYLRPETAQGIFVNFSNVLNTTRKKLPLGIAQIGKAFRNEVTTGSFIFRMKEFEQMEIEYFVRPDNAEEFYNYWVKQRYDFYLDTIGLNKENLRLRKHSKEELAHYAKACTDIEFNFPFGWSELEGIANRGDYDLAKHAEESKKDLSYFDQKTKEKIIPHVIEPSAGVDRTFFAVISDAFCQEEVKGRKRTILKLKPHLAPYQVAIFPLLKKNKDIVKLAKNIFYDIKNKVPATYDDTASIGKLYRRQDEVGTPFCVTVDVDSLTDKKVTVRSRDSMAQDRISIDKVLDFVSDKLS
ncbi:MAG: glycine--tRNA ligase [Candidatus Omnitrophica bacterium]|nr:glycine--tRNA ligase [Candidatus Omnitrophota bacterium]MCF7893557.1 glycine--tRNA ligase [Candidatus Omnitrophota bacterium]